MISVIIPVYNTAKFLEQCINSVLNQTYTDFELILVDDGSTDGSGDICAEYADKDSRIRVICKENGGVSSARNVGLDYAQGEYIAFVDSDDYVNTKYLEDLISEIKKSDADLIIADYTTVNPGGFLENKDVLPSFAIDFFESKNCEDRGISEYYHQLVLNFRVFGPYCKLYKALVIDRYHIRFDESLFSAEDFDFNYQYCRHIKRLICISSDQYFYRVGYKENNNRYISDSDIKSVHIMAEGLLWFAREMLVYDIVKEDIETFIARKHYYSRMPMVFLAKKEDDHSKSRYYMYHKLKKNQTYRSCYKNGLKSLHFPILYWLVAKCDFYLFWRIAFFSRKILKSM